MGKIARTYYKSNRLEKRLNNSIWVDICENIHLHYRDLRMEFSLSEFMEWSAHIVTLRSLLLRWLQDNPSWKESDSPETFNNAFVKWLDGYSPGSVSLGPPDYWKGRLALEKQANGTYHLHYHDLRLEFREKEFHELIRAFLAAADGQVL